MSCTYYIRLGSCQITHTVSGGAGLAFQDCTCFAVGCLRHDKTDLGTLGAVKSLKFSDCKTGSQTCQGLDK